MRKEEGRREEGGSEGGGRKERRGGSEGGGREEERGVATVVYTHAHTHILKLVQQASRELQ